MKTIFKVLIALFIACAITASMFFYANYESNKSYAKGVNDGGIATIQYILSETTNCKSVPIHINETWTEDLVTAKCVSQSLPELCKGAK